MIPAFMSEHMIRMSNYTGAVEEHLGKLEEELEVRKSVLYGKYFLNEKMNATAAEKRVRIEVGELEGQIKYLSRIVSSAWKQTGVIQSRINHLVKQEQGQI